MFVKKANQYKMLKKLLMILMMDLNKSVNSLQTNIKKAFTSCGGLKNLAPIGSYNCFLPFDELSRKNQEEIWPHWSKYSLFGVGVTLVEEGFH